MWKIWNSTKARKCHVCMSFIKSDHCSESFDFLLLFTRGMRTARVRAVRDTSSASEWVIHSSETAMPLCYCRSIIVYQCLRRCFYSNFTPPLIFLFSFFFLLLLWNTVRIGNRYRLASLHKCSFNVPVVVARRRRRHCRRSRCVAIALKRDRLFALAVMLCE